MKSRLADAALERLANATADEPAMTEAEVLRVLASIARRGKPSDRLRAAELIGRQLGMFREVAEHGGLTLEQLVPKHIPRPRTGPAAEAEIVVEPVDEGGG
jgi:hypothetical protein